MKKKHRDYRDDFKLQMPKLPTKFRIAFAIWTVVCLALLVGIIYVAIHFIQKYW